MPDYAADDAAFIAKRLKEIEEEKREAREKTPPLVNEQALEEEAANMHNDPSYW